MIIIKTANGDRFINESEAQSVTHNKEYGYVVITFKDGHSENAFQVESMYYTNKQDVEIRDNGLLMAAVASDVEYYKEMNESAFRYLERVADRRNQMERSSKCSRNPTAILSIASGSSMKSKRCGAIALAPSSQNSTNIAPCRTTTNFVRIATRRARKSKRSLCACRQRLRNSKNGRNVIAKHLSALCFAVFGSAYSTKRHTSNPNSARGQPPGRYCF